MTKRCKTMTRPLLVYVGCMFCLIWPTSQIGSRCDGTSSSPVLSPHPHEPKYALCCLLCIPLCISDYIPIMVYYGIFHSYLYYMYIYIYTGYFFWLNHLFCWLNHLYTVCFPPRNGWSLPETTPRATVNAIRSRRRRCNHYAQTWLA